jgi:hypothetical protein
MSIQSAIDRLNKMSKENKTPIRVTRGLLKAAMMEIEMQSKSHGETFATRMVLIRLRDALGVKQ